MPSSAVHTFTEPAEYVAAIRAMTIDLTVTGRGRFSGKRTRIDLHRLWMKRLSENLPRIVHSAFVSGRAIVTFWIHTGPGLLWSGAPLLPTNIVRHVEGENAFQCSPGPAHWGAMLLPVADMVSIGATLAGLDLTPPKDPLILTPRPVAMARLQQLHAVAGQLAEDAPEIIGNPDVARGLEDELIEAMVGCFAESKAGEDSVARRQHELIMRRFRMAVEEKPDQSLYITEICKMIGVSRRTLEVCCQEQLGVGPKRYLALRRLHLARRALREAALDTTTVTDIATRYGFWHFGRFAGEYRSLFGESPSATLHRQAE